MEVVGADGKVVPHVYCIGDANGKYMLAHAASAQGISAIENMLGRPHVLNHLSVPAACFTHPEVSFVGVTQDKAEEMAAEKGFKLGVAKTSFKANSKVGAGGLGGGGCRLEEQLWSDGQPTRAGGSTAGVRDSSGAPWWEKQQRLQANMICKPSAEAAAHTACVQQQLQQQQHVWSC
jgi:hypothetical protein